MPLRAHRGMTSASSSALEQRVAVLDRGGRADVDALLELGGVEVAHPVGDDLPASRSSSKTEMVSASGDAAIELVGEVEIDAIDAQALEARGELTADACRRQALIAVGGHPVERLGGERWAGCAASGSRRRSPPRCGLPRRHRRYRSGGRPAPTPRPSARAPRECDRPCPKNSGAEPTPPKFPQPRATRGTRWPAAPRGWEGIWSAAGIGRYLIRRADHKEPSAPARDPAPNRVLVHLTGIGPVDVFNTPLSHPERTPGEGPHMTERRAAAGGLLRPQRRARGHGAGGHDLPHRRQRPHLGLPRVHRHRAGVRRAAGGGGARDVAGRARQPTTVSWVSIGSSWSISGRRCSQWGGMHMCVPSSARSRR